MLLLSALIELGHAAMDGGPGCVGVGRMWSGLDTRLDINPRVDDGVPDR